MEPVESSEQRFPLGTTVITQNALTRLTQDDILSALRRHSIGDWGEMDEESKQQNDRSLKESHTLLSVYRSSRKEVFWIVTERDRSVTTVLMPEDH